MLISRVPHMKSMRSNAATDSHLSDFINGVDFAGLNWQRFFMPG